MLRCADIQIFSNNFCFIFRRKSFITRIDVTAEGAANGHISGQVNEEVITNGGASAEIKLPNGNDEVTVDKDVTTNDIVETLSEESTTNEIKGTEEITTNEIKSTEEITTNEFKVKYEVQSDDKKESENQTDEDKNLSPLSTIFQLYRGG